MADNDRVVFPDEVADETEKASTVDNTARDTNTIEEKKEEKSETVAPPITMRNMISVPVNCPAGQQLGADGVCREVF